MLERLRADYCELPLWVLWDGASYHRAEAVRARAKELGIELVPLPAYSPDLMPVEALWRLLRQEVTAHHCHQSAAELIDRVLTWSCWSTRIPRRWLQDLTSVSIWSLSRKKLRVP